MPTFRNTLFHLHRQVGVCPCRWNRQSVPKCRHTNFRRREITQQKAYNIQKTAKVWDKVYYLFLYIGFLSVLDGSLSEEKPFWRLCVCVFLFALKDGVVTRGTWQMVLIFKWSGRRILQNMYRLPHSMLSSQVFYSIYLCSRVESDRGDRIAVKCYVARLVLLAVVFLLP
jgi:hypothetical protein